MNIAVSEIFKSIQGEGRYTGEPSIFIRTLGCNLRCVFKGSMCDTPYTSFNPEKPLYISTEDVVKEVNKLQEINPVKHIVFTGGEPCLFKEAINEIVSELNMDYNDLIYTVETNGTMGVIEDCPIDLYSISPKLSTSVDWECKYLNEQQRDDHNNKRINIESIFDIITKYSYQLKFVYSGPESVAEINEIIERLNNLANQRYDFNKKDIGAEMYWLDHPEDNIMLMPEGTNNGQIDNISKECVEECIKNGWRFCDRLHIRIWGDKRGV